MSCLMNNVLECTLDCLLCLCDRFSRYVLLFVWVNRSPRLFAESNFNYHSFSVLSLSPEELLFFAIQLNVRTNPDPYTWTRTLLFSITLGNPEFWTEAPIASSCFRRSQRRSGSTTTRRCRRASTRTPTSTSWCAMRGSCEAAGCIGGARARLARRRVSNVALLVVELKFSWTSSIVSSSRRTAPSQPSHCTHRLLPPILSLFLTHSLSFSFSDFFLAIDRALASRQMILLFRQFTYS